MDFETKSTYPRVCIVLLNWNSGPDIIKCLNSIQNLTYPNYFPVVVDNASSDTSFQDIANSFPSVRLINAGKNLGFNGGNNVGIRHGLDQGADYFWLLNNDTVVDPHSLSHMVSLLGKDAKLGAVGSCIYYMDEPSRVQIWGGLKVNMLLGIPQIITDPSKASQVEYLVGASILLRRKVLEDIGLLDDKYFMYWDDADLGYRMRGLGWQIAIATESKIWHKWSTASDKKKKAKVDLLNSRAGVRFLTRYSPYPWLSIILGLSLRVFYRLLQRNLPAIHSLLLGTYQGIADLRKSKLLE